MGLFDELGDNALKPGQGAELALRRELETRRERFARPGYVYRGAGDLLLQHGRFFNGRVLPDQYADLQGPPNQCFGNALTAAQARGLTYYEGVYSTGGGHFTTHGWVADAEGVVEVTFPTHNVEDLWDFNIGPILPPEHWGYWGVPFRWELVEWHGTHLGLPMLDRSHMDALEAPWLDMRELHDTPILKVPYDPDRTELAL